MKGLIVKDIKLMMMQKKYLLMLFVIAFLLSLSFDRYFMLTYFAFMVSLFILSTISYDEFDNGYAFLFTLPLTREVYVIEKYLFSFIISVLAILFSLVVCVVQDVMDLGVITQDPLIIAMGFIPVLFLINSISIPVQLKFGAEKGRLANIGVLGGIALIVIGGIKLCEALNINVDSLIMALSQLPAAIIIICALVMTTCIIAVSLKVSMIIMKHKEF